MRVKVASQDLNKFFEQIKVKLDKPWQIIALEIGNIHPRTLQDWRRGQYLPQSEVLEKLSEAALVPLPPIQERLDPYWYVRKGARLGAIRRAELYGNLGTPEGRRKGGQISIKKNRLLKNKWFLSKEINKPEQSENLAEFVGAILGDGGITPYQVTITLHRILDIAYAEYLAKLGERLFRVKPSLRIRMRDATCRVVFSSLKLRTHLSQMGLPMGNKVKNQVEVPKWIRRKQAFINACIRGLMDTDGCFYVDRHQIKGKLYFNAALNFTNRSIPLLSFLKGELERLGYHPTQKTPYSVFLRREQEIARYFQEIGSSNPKHKNKYKEYLKNRHGGVG